MGSRPTAPPRAKGPGAPRLGRSIVRSAAERAAAPSEAQPPALAGILAAKRTCRRPRPPFFLSEGAGAILAPQPENERRREAAGALPSPRARARPGGACRYRCRHLPNRRVCDTRAARARPAPRPRPLRAGARPAPSPPSRPRPFPPGARPPDLGPSPAPLSPGLRRRTAPPQRSPPPAVASAPAPGSGLRAPGSRGAASPARFSARRRLRREVAIL